MAGRRPNILLFRHPGALDLEDPYVAEFAAIGFRAWCVPVLRFEFVNEAALRERLAHPKRYGGLILTSRRAVEAMERAGPVPEAWRELHTFVIGPATAEAAAERIGLRPFTSYAGGASGIAMAAADEADEEPVLYLTGDRRRGELPEELAGLRVAFEELTVYRTLPHPPDLSAAPPPDWVAFFSPSGVEAALELDGFPWNRISRAAIGPTTAAALRDAGYPADAVAAYPDAKALASAVAYACLFPDE